MYFINQVHFETTMTGRVLHIIQQLTGVFDLGTRCRIHLNQVNKTSLGNIFAGTTHTTGFGSNTGFTIE